MDLDSDIAAAPIGGPTTAEACIPVWRDGPLENPEVAPAGSVPPLTACVAETGSLAVFPTDDRSVSDTLGLAYPEPSSRDTADRIRQLDADLQTYFSTNQYADMGDADTRVGQILDDSGFGEWTIETQNASETRPCASYSLEPEAATIHLVPIPDN